MKKIIKILFLIFIFQLMFSFAEGYEDEYHCIKVKILDSQGQPYKFGDSQYSTPTRLYSFRQVGDEKFTNLLFDRESYIDKNTSTVMTFIPRKIGPKVNSYDDEIFTGVFKLEIIGLGFAGSPDYSYENAAFIELNLESSTSITKEYTATMSKQTSKISGTVRDLDGSLVNNHGGRAQLFSAYADLDSHSGIFTDSSYSGSCAITHEGKYLFEKLGKGKYFVQIVDADGYFPVWYKDAYGYTDRVTVSIDENGLIKDDIDFVLRKKATVKGTVLKSDNSPVASGVKIVALLKKDLAQGKFTYVNSTQTGTNGKYSLDLPSGVEVVLKAEPTDEDYFDIFYSGKVLATQATAINLAPNQIAEDYNFVLQKYSKLRVDIGEPDVKVEVFGWNNWQDFVTDATTNSGGYCDIKLKLLDNSKDCMLRYSKPGYVTRFGNKSGTGHNYWLSYPDESKNKFSFSQYTSSTVIDKGLEKGAAISGKITATGSNQVVTVNVFDENGAKYFTSVTLNSNGGPYTIPGVPAGKWLVKAEKQGCVGEYYGETTSTKDALLVQTTAGGTVNNINIKIAPAWTISGQVQDNLGNKLSDVEIKAFKYVDGYKWLAETKTDSDGKFTVTGYNENVKLFLQAEKTGYLKTLYNNKSEITISSGENKTDYNFILPAMAVISGKITDGANNLAGVTVSAFLKNDLTWLAAVTTDAQGQYELTVSAGYDVIVKAEKSGYAAEFYDNVTDWQSANGFNLMANQVKTGVNFALDPVWTLQGRVQLAGSAKHVAKVEVFKYNNWQQFVGSTQSDNDGHFKLTGKGNIDTMIKISSGNWVTLLYPNQVYSKILPENKVTLEPNKTKNLGTINLALGATISGKVLATAGVGEVITVNVFAQNGKDLLKFVTVNATGSGQYTITGVPAGSWLVKAEKQGLPAYYYQDTVEAPKAQLVKTVAGGTVSQIDIEIKQPWLIKGTVKNGSSSGAGIANVPVKVFRYEEGFKFVAEAKTDTLGRYTINGNVDGVFFIKTEAFGAYEAKYFPDIDGNQPWTKAEKITLNRGETKNNADIILSISPIIKGQVKSSILGNLSSAVVEAYDISSGQAVLFTSQTTDEHGQYTLRVPIGKPLKLRARAKAHYPKLYNTDTEMWSAAQIFNLASAAVVNDINFNLKAFWKVAGRVNLSDGKSAYGAKIYLTQYNNWSNVIASVNVQADGSFEIISGKSFPELGMLSCIKDGYKPVIHPDYQLDPAQNNAPAACSLAVELGVLNKDNVVFNLQKIITQLSKEEIRKSIKSGPNPFNPDKEQIHIQFKTDRDAYVRLKIYSLGRELIHSAGRSFPAGQNEFIWDGLDNFAKQAANGVYLAYIEIKLNNATVIKKVNKIAILR